MYVERSSRSRGNKVRVGKLRIMTITTFTEVPEEIGDALKQDYKLMTRATVQDARTGSRTDRMKRLRSVTGILFTFLAKASKT